MPAPAAVLVMEEPEVDERRDSAMADVRLGPEAAAKTVVVVPLGNGTTNIPVPVAREVAIGIEPIDEMVTVVNADAVFERLPAVAEVSRDVADANKELPTKGGRAVLV